MVKRNETEGQRYRRMAWWREAKLGMVIHWGIYAVPAGVWKGRRIGGIGEWIMYHVRIPIREYGKLAEQFNPVKFDATEWVRIAKAAGMKWIVFTAKHHDGFCMFNTELTDYNIVEATPFKRDPLKELSEACEKENLRLGFYYSQTLDWHHPDGTGNNWDYNPDKKDFSRYLETYVKPQLRELLTNYGPVAVMWFDMGTPTPEQARELREWVRKFQPDTIISGRISPRWEEGMGDYRERGDNEIPAEKVGDYWETPATINDTWGFKSYDHNWKSTGVLIQKLVEIVSRGGNYLLNVGPTAEGIIPQPSVDRLAAMGKWLRVNGESIYGANANPYPTEFAWGTATSKPGKLYLHALAWPPNGEIDIPDCRIRKAYLLADVERKSLVVNMRSGGVRIKLPSKTTDPIDTVVVAELAK